MMMMTLACSSLSVCESSDSHVPSGQIQEYSKPPSQLTLLYNESFTRVDRGLARDLSQHDSDRLEPGLPLLVPVGKLVPAFFVVLFLPPTQVMIVSANFSGLVASGSTTIGFAFSKKWL